MMRWRMLVGRYCIVFFLFFKPCPKTMEIMISIKYRCRSILSLSLLFLFECHQKHISSPTVHAYFSIQSTVIVPLEWQAFLEWQARFPGVTGSVFWIYEEFCVGLVEKTDFPWSDRRSLEWQAWNVCIRIFIMHIVNYFWKTARLGGPLSVCMWQPLRTTFRLHRSAKQSALNPNT